MIEDSLRETFAAQVGGAPQIEGLAEAAMRRARKIRRRRRAVATGMAAVVVFALLGIAGLRVISPGFMVPANQGTTAGRQIEAPTEDGAPEPEGGPSASTRQIEVVQDGEIYTSNRARVQLPTRGTTTSAYRARDGYLVITARPQSHKQLLLLDDEGNNQVVLDDATSIAVSAHGDKIAWANDETMSVADRSAGDADLVKRVTIKVPAYAAPVAFLGNEVIIARSENAPQGRAFDLWYPARPVHVEKWDANVVRLFGARPDGKGVYAQVADETGGERLCLALLVPEQPFKVQDKTCGLPAAVEQGGGVSPDGRWLAYPVAGHKQIAMVDLSEVFRAEDPRIRVWDAQTASARTVWLNSTTFVVDNGTNFVSLNPTQQGRVDTVQGGSAGKILVEPLTG